MDDISGKWLKMADKTAKKKETLSSISEKQAAARKKLVKISDLLVEPKFERYIRKHTEEEYKALYASIEQDGKIREPLTVMEAAKEGKYLLVDGHHRLKVAKELVEKGMFLFESLPVNIERFANDDEVFVWMLRNQLGRRNLSPFERAEIGFRITAFLEDLALKKKQHQEVDSKLLSKWIKAPDASKIDYAKIVSEITGVPRTTIIRAKKIHGLASAKLKEEIRAGDISISKAYDKIVEAEKQKKKTEKIDKRKRDFEKNNFALNEIETLLSKELLGSTIGFKGKEIKASVVQKKKRSMLYAVSYHHEIFYLRVYYQTFEAEEGPEHFTVFLMHEGMDFKVPKGAGVLTVNPLGKIKLVKKCQAAKVVSEQQELKLLRSMIMENLAG